MKSIAILVLLGCFALCGCSRKPDTTSAAASGPLGSPTAAGVRAAAARPSANAPSAPNGEPILVAGQPTGYFRLADGLLIRTAKRTCPSARPRQEECRGTRRQCKADAECSDKPNGYCKNLGDNLGCGCHYGCLADAECGQNQACLCGDPVGTCVDVTCSQETCAASTHCATYHDGCNYKPFACIDHVGTQTCTF